MKFATGTVSDIDEHRVRVRVRLPAYDNLRTAWLEVIQRNTLINKDYWLPDLGEQVKIILDETGDDGVVLGSVYSSADKPAITSRDKRRTDFADGAFIEYDRQQSAMTIGGAIRVLNIATHAEVEVRSESSVTVYATQGVTVQSPRTHITGDLIVDGKVTASDGMAVSGNISVEGKIDASGKITGA